MSGWYRMKRGWLDHQIFRPDGKFSRAEAWVWMVENAAFKDVVIDIGGKPYTVTRGSLCYAERFMADKFGWSQKALRTFLDLLEAHGSIRQSVASTGHGTKSKRKQVTLCNYDKYQASEIKTEAKENQNGSKEEVISNSSVTNVTDAAASGDLVKMIFDAGVAILASGGIAQKQARSLIGKWRGQHGDTAVLDALMRAKKESPSEPVAFLEGCFRFKKSASPLNGDQRILPDGRTQVFTPNQGWVAVHV